jgi:hypothetical protein
MDLLEPPWAILGERAIDDVGDPSIADEAWCQKGSGTDEDPRMEVGRRLAQIVWNGSQHLLFHGDLSFNGRTQGLPLRQLHTTPR